MGMLIISSALLDSEDDEVAFRQLYDVYKIDMNKIAFTILKEKTLAEDAVQEAFLSIASNFSDLKFKKKCKTTRAYFFCVVKSRSIDILRKRQNFISSSTEDIENIAIDNCSDISRIMDGKEIIKCIKKLSLDYQIILTLKYIYGYTDKEIASILTLTTNNAKTRCSRAKKTLNALLSQREEE